MAFGNKSKLKMGSKVLEVIKFLLKVHIDHITCYNSQYIYTHYVYIVFIYTLVYFIAVANNIENPLVKRIFYIKPSSCFYERVVYS